LSWKEAFRPWSIVSPFFAWLLIGAGLFFAPSPGWLVLLMGITLVATVLSAVHFAELIAAKVGEPFGTLILAIAVTVIEVALMASVVMSGDESTAYLPRDTLFATVMIIVNGLVGLCLVFGAAKHFEQRFRLQGVSGALATLISLTIVTLVLPSYTTTVSGPFYSPLQLGFVAVVSLALYGTFVLVQTVRHPADFVKKGSEPENKNPMSAALTGACIVALLLGVSAVLVTAKSLSPAVIQATREAGLPQGVVAVTIAMIVLLPEGLAAIKAARANQLQTSLNLALGSALATIGLTIPTIAAVSILSNWRLPLGLDQKETVLLAVSLLVATLSLGTGRTTVLQGAVHLVLFAVFLFTTAIP
jgi:Ca2+:H+ antiporter